MIIQPKFDLEAICRDNPIENVVQQHGFVALKASGREFVGLCRFHQERTPSFSVIPATADQSGKGFYHCFGCGAHGDSIAFVMRVYGVTLPEACQILGGNAAPQATVAPADLHKAADPYEGLTALPATQTPLVAGVAVDLWNAKRLFDPKPKPLWVARPSAGYPYRDAAGKLLGYVLRIEMPDGGKVTPMVRYARCHDGRARWALWPFPEPRPLYRREIWANSPGPIWIVEGEKSADAVAALLGKHAATWPGGTNGVKYADWSQLAGRDCYLWGDCDAEGEAAMLGRLGDDPKLGVIDHAAAAGARIRGVVAWDKSKPRGFDAGDVLRDGWTRAELVGWLTQQMQAAQGAVTVERRRA